MRTTPRRPRTRSYKGACRVVFDEIGFVYLVELGVQRHVGTENLDEHKVVHSHASLGENGLHAVQGGAGLLLNIVRQLTCVGINTDLIGEIKRVIDQHAIAEGRLNDLGQVDVTPGGLRTILCPGRLRRHGNGSRDDDGEPSTNVFHGTLL